MPIIKATSSVEVNRCLWSAHIWGPRGPGTGLSTALPETEVLLKLAQGLIYWREGSRQAAPLTCPPNHQFLPGGIQMTSDLRQSRLGVSNLHSGKAQGSRTRTATWQALSQIPRSPWVF